MVCIIFYCLILCYTESEILITRRCECNDLLYCTCHEQQKPVVKLGDFSSSSDVIGWESLFITAVDIWSFGYLLIAIFLGKHRPLALTTEQVNKVIIKLSLYLKFQYVAPDGGTALL